MTVASAYSPARFNGNGSTTAFAFTFPIFVEGDLAIYLKVDSTGVETLQTITTHYTVSTGPWPSGGTVTMVTAPATGETLVIKRSLAATQTLDLAENDIMPAEDLEDALDRTVMLVQENTEALLRSIKVPPGEASVGDFPTAVDRASKFLSFDASGNPIAAAGTSADLGPVSAYIDTLLSAANAAAALTTLTAPGLTLANVFTKTQTGAKGADVASASALTLGTDGNYFDVTGTTAITSIATVGVGTVVTLHFDGALTLTHHATDLILPGAANITTAAGDEAVFVEYATGDWRCVSYQRAANAPFADALTSKSGQYFASGAITFADDNVHSEAHGLGAIPRLVQVVLRCHTAADGFAIGDEISCWMCAGGTGDLGTTIRVDATNVHIVTGINTQIIADDDTNRVSVNSAGYEWRVRAWL